jgi:hypothetical protein
MIHLDQAGLSKGLTNLFKYSNISTPTLLQIKPLLENEDSDIFLKLIKALPNFIYYKATLRLKKDAA